LVEQPAGLVAGSPVGLPAVGGEPHRGLQDLAPLLHGGVDRGQPLLGGAQFIADAVLLGAEHGRVDRAGVVGVQQLAALAFQLAHPPGHQLPFADGAVLSAGELGVECGAQPRQSVRGELDLLVQALDGGLQQVGRDVGLVAAGAGLVLLPQAVEVEVAALGEGGRDD
jgi:hypothetical protein